MRALLLEGVLGPVYDIYIERERERETEMASLPLYKLWRKKYLYLHNGTQLYVHYNLKKDQEPKDAITCSEVKYPATTTIQEPLINQPIPL